MTRLSMASCQGTQMLVSILNHVFLKIKSFFENGISSANEYTSIEDAVSVAEYVIANGLAGAMTWDVNRDCRL